MPDFGIIAGDTDATVYVRLRDSITGVAKTGLVFNSAGASCTYTLPLAAAVTITLATQTVTGAHTDGGFVEVNNANPKGLYRLDLPDAGIASGSFSLISIEFDGILEETMEIPLHQKDVNAIADAVWDEDIEAAHGADATAGLLLRALGQGISNETRDANLLDQLKRVIAMVEIQRSSHTHTPSGNIFFVDPVNGATHASGARGGIADPYLTIQDCHDSAVTDSNHDVIMLIPGAASGVTTHTAAATTTISKRYVFIRGPGRDMFVLRTGDGDTLAITADGVELSGFQLETAATGSGKGIQVTDADFLRVHDLWINATQGDGINLLRANNCQIHDNFFTDTGAGGSGDGIHIVGTAGSSNKNSIHSNHFRDCQGDSIKIEDGSTLDTNIHGNGIEGSTGWGINIGASSTDAFVHDNRLGNNASGNITDAGTTTILINNYDTWDEVLASHATAGTTGKAVADIETGVTTILAGGADRFLLVDTTIATLASQTSFTLTAGSADNDAYNNCTIVIEDATTAVQKAVGIVSDYVGATKTVTLKYDPTVFTMATTDKVYILAENALKSTAANRQLDVTATGAAGIDWGNIENQTADVDLTDTLTNWCNFVGLCGANADALSESDIRLQCNNALALINLDHLVSDAFTVPPIVAGTYWDQMLNNGTASYDRTTDSLQAQRDNIGTGGVGLTLVSLAATGLDAITQAATGMVEIAKAVWDRVITAAQHNIPTSAGRRLRLSSEIVQVDSAVDDPGAAATTTVFNTDLTEADDFWNDALIVFTSGSLLGQAKPIIDYANINGQLTLSKPLTSAPADNVTFAIVSTHIHPVSQIADGVWDEATSGHTTAGTFGEQCKTDIDAILAASGTLTPSERDSVASAILGLANGIESGHTLQQALRLLLAACVGKLSGAATPTNTMRDINDTKDRITATVDADGNRIAVATDAT